MSDALPAEKRFDYIGWALEVCSQMLEGDLGCGFAVADETPDPERARKAVDTLIHRLRNEAARRKAK